MLGAIAGILFATGLSIAGIAIELNKLRRVLIAGQLRPVFVEERDGVPFRATSMGKVEALAVDGYRVFKSVAAFERFLARRPDLK